jgi:AcrR family transcriptional regulator
MEEKARPPVTRTFVPPPSPLTPKSARTRGLLLALAAELFIDRGYEAVSMQDIADRADLTKGALYGHFRSKGQLLVEVLRWRQADVDEHSDFRDLTLERGIRLLGAATRRDLRLLEVDAAAAARHDHEVASGLADLYHERQTTIRATVEDLPDPDAAAWLVSIIEAGIGVSEATGMPAPSRERMDATLVAALAGVYLGLGPDAASDRLT